MTRQIRKMLLLFYIAVLCKNYATPVIYNTYTMEYYVGPSHLLCKVREILQKYE